MEHRISATELARKLGDVLGQVRYRGDSFLVERNGAPVARLEPAAEASMCSLGEALGSWVSAGAADSSFASALERVGKLDRPMRNPWD